ncbi:soluble NSF attachment protein [Phlyctochytrium arcticum]|nr:soluble NSF attachment protein [Phlyctochytrium arcticum]
MADQLQEGLKLLAAGEKYRTKKSLFGSAKPDWDSSLQNYEAAAICFRNAKAYDYACDALVKAATAHHELDSLYLAAKALENAANLTIQYLTNPTEAASLYQKASDYYMAQGSVDRAAEALEKAAKALEDVQYEESVKLYEQACDAYEEEGKLRIGIDVFKRFLSFTLRHASYPKSLEISERLCRAYEKLEQALNLRKQLLTSVIIQLHLGDHSGATAKMMQLSSTFPETGEANLAAALCEGGSSADLERSNAFTSLENEVIKLAKKLKMEAANPPQVPPKTSALASGLQDEIEEEGFL